MNNHFLKAVQFLVDPSDGYAAEGGYINDPDDPGGETKYGISKKYHPNLDIKNLTLDQAINIYKLEYWDANNLEQMAFPLSVAALDAFVQHGPKKVRAMLEESQGNVQKFINCRVLYYLTLIQKNPKLIKFKKGWLRRMNDLSKYCTIVSQND